MNEGRVPRSEDLRQRIDQARTRTRTAPGPSSPTRVVAGLVTDIGIVRVAQEDVRLADGGTSIRTVVTHMVRVREGRDVRAYLHRSVEDVPVSVALTMPEDYVTFEADDDGMVTNYRLRRLQG
jgi:hypothetical protein